MSSTAASSASAGSTGSGARRRLSLRTVLILLAAIAVAVAVLDQITKNWAVESLPLLEPQPLVGELLQLTLLYNTGAAWGMGSEITPVVTGLQIAIVIGVLVFAVRSVRSAWYATALGLILGGALGNIHDRLLREPGPFYGAVVDFLELPNWPVFNVADMAVVTGAVLVIALGLFGAAADPAAAEAERAEKAERERAKRSDAERAETEDADAERAETEDADADEETSP